MAKRNYKRNWGIISRKARVRGMTNIEYVNWLIAEHGGVTAAAREAGVTRSALYWQLAQANDSEQDRVNG